MPGYRTAACSPLAVKHFSARHITAVHDKDFVRYLQTVCTSLGEEEAVYPYVFPVRNASRPPTDRPTRAGYYCIDTFTPLTRNAFVAATRAVDCALTAAARLLGGQRAPYALVRPPGHHAERRLFGGFCYFNNSAVAAHYLSATGKVAVLDIDYHHGNGTQEIFYQRPDVLTVSIHGHPRFAYPYFSGFAEERERPRGRASISICRFPNTSTPSDIGSLTEGRAPHRPFSSGILVIALGFDTGRGDSTGTWPSGPKISR
ncbi:MAG: hypothetical protein R2864_09195 [Syntrophotaleaceae bacterium]